MKYRKKPVVIDAVQFTGKNYKTIEAFMENGCCQKGAVDNTLWIFTLEGAVLANKGDYIIKGIVGEFYPCKQDIFAKTYEKE